VKFPKNAPLKSEENLERIRQSQCMVCGSRPPNDPHHLRTRGASGGDELENLVALCRKHHVEIHKIGVKTFIDRYKLAVSFDSGWPKRIVLPEKAD